MVFAHNSYLKYDELTALLKKMATQFPRWAQLSSIGQLPSGREIWLMTVTDHEFEKPSEKPAIWVDGNTHASELAGCQASVHLIDHLLSNADSDDRMAELLKTRTFYVVPRISVDGAEEVMTGTSWLRSSPLKFPGDEPKENFRIHDIDGDGEIVQMRFQDPSGAYKISKKDSRLMIPREPDDFFESDGPFYHLVDEGDFENFDGFHRRYLEQRRHDLNRQAPVQYSPKEKGAGPLPLTLQEGKFLAEAVVARPNIVTVVTHHTFGGYLLRPSSLRPDSELPTLDLEVFKIMGQIGEKLTGYRAVSVYHDFKYDPKENITGAWDDWYYDHRGVFSWTPEIWNLPSQVGVKFEKLLQLYQDPGEETLVKVLHWCDQNLEAGSFYRKWKPFSHPQLGEIEIGGWRTLYTWSNPPTKFLKAEIEKLTQFTLRLAQMAPRVVLHSVETEKVGADLFRVKVAVQNQGFLSTSVSEAARSLKIYKSPLVTLKLAPGQKLISGKDEFVVSHLSGRIDARPWISPVWGGDIDNKHEDQFTWVVQGAGDFEFRANYQTGGVVQTLISLGSPTSV